MTTAQNTSINMPKRKLEDEQEGDKATVDCDPKEESVKQPQKQCKVDSEHPIGLSRTQELESDNQNKCTKNDVKSVNNKKGDVNGGNDCVDTKSDNVDIAKCNVKAKKDNLKSASGTEGHNSKCASDVESDNSKDCNTEKDTLETQTTSNTAVDSGKDTVTNTAVTGTEGHTVWSSSGRFSVSTAAESLSSSHSAEKLNEKSNERVGEKTSEKLCEASKDKVEATDKPEQPSSSITKQTVAVEHPADNQNQSKQQQSDDGE